MKQSKN